MRYIVNNMKNYCTRFVLFAFAVVMLSICGCDSGQFVDAVNIVADEIEKNSTSATLEEPFDENVEDIIELKFRNNKLLEEHFEKHGQEFPYSTKEEYLAGANKMLNNPQKLHKKEAEDGDDVYYLEETNEFIIVSLDGYIRTYFKPSRGIAYFNSQ